MKDQFFDSKYTYKTHPEFSEYLVREDGEIYFLGRKRCDGVTVPPKILKAKLEKNGYLRVSLRRKLYTVHRVVAVTYLSESFSQGMQINHKDGNKLNNYYSNLEWTTSKDNLKHAFDNGLRDKLYGENSHFSIYGEKDVEEIVKLLKKGNNPSKIARISKYPRLMCSRINNGKAWRKVLDRMGIESYPITKVDFRGK